jgi:predicted RNA-binding protein Jag
LEPLGPSDRRIIHHAFKNDPDVETHSVEMDGSDKKVLLLRPRR